MKPKELTTREVAERLGVPQGTVRVWLLKDPPRFPNARREETGRGPMWLIPARDLKGFKVRPRGRPAKPKPAKKRADQ
jgi:hypothetical protein